MLHERWNYLEFTSLSPCEEGAKRKLKDLDDTKFKMIKLCRKTLVKKLTRRLNDLLFMDLVFSIGLA